MDGKSEMRRCGRVSRLRCKTCKQSKHKKKNRGPGCDPGGHGDFLPLSLQKQFRRIIVRHLHMVREEWVSSDRGPFLHIYRVQVPGGLFYFPKWQVRLSSTSLLSFCVIHFLLDRCKTRAVPHPTEWREKGEAN